jgi:hypothetical protein
MDGYCTCVLEQRARPIRNMEWPPQQEESRRRFTVRQGVNRRCHASDPAVQQGVNRRCHASDPLVKTAAAQQVKNAADESLAAVTVGC